jgi:hypothetical protein
MNDDMPALPGLQNPMLEFLGVTMSAWRDGYVEMQMPFNRNGATSDEGNGFDM